MKKMILALIGFAAFAINLGVMDTLPAAAQQKPVAPWVSLPGTVADISMNADGQGLCGGARWLGLALGSC